MVLNICKFVKIYNFYCKHVFKTYFKKYIFDKILIFRTFQANNLDRENKNRKKFHDTYFIRKNSNHFEQRI